MFQEGQIVLARILEETYNPPPCGVLADRTGEEGTETRTESRHGDEVSKVNTPPRLIAVYVCIKSANDCDWGGCH